ncbi:MAG: hypothetical protein LQ350_006130 [Teloschistes chrysophthalmus]|nr:MAG: hypothetical protein LQ350_006130 [Niorma chrysophthalma]
MTLGFTFGKGHKKLRSHRTGVDLCIGAAGQNVHNIAPVHGSIVMHPRSGAVMVQGSSLNNPPVVFDDTERIPLFTDQTHVISARKTRLGVGDLRFDLDICTYEVTASKPSGHVPTAHPEEFPDLNFHHNWGSLLTLGNPVASSPTNPTAPHTPHSSSSLPHLRNTPVPPPNRLDGGPPHQHDKWEDSRWVFDWVKGAWVPEGPEPPQ